MATMLKSLKLGDQVVLQSDLTGEVSRIENLITQKAPKIGAVTDETSVTDLLTTLGATFPVEPNNDDGGGGGE